MESKLPSPEERLVNAKKARIVKYYQAASLGRISPQEAVKEIEALCSSEKNKEVLEFKQEAFKRLKKLDK